MKAKKLFFALAFVCANLISFAQTTEPCGTDELILRNPFLEEAINNRSMNNCDTDYDLPSSEVLTIPIVFHVMHRGTPLGVDENITNEQIYSAVENLTDRFRATPGALGVDENTIDSRFDFCLAGTDPDGNPTNGIVRYDMSGYSNYMEDGVTTNPSFYSDAMPDNTLKNIGCWDPDFYCNVYIVTEINGNNGGNGVQGYAYLGPTGDCRDGIVLLYNVVGTEGTLKAGRDMNTTLPHEMGHYLTLYHTFHNGASSCDYVESNCCTQGDRVCDTPIQTSSANACSSVCDSDPANYMDYTSQTCKTLFTEGQIERMRDCVAFQRQDLVSGTIDCFQLDDEPTCDVALMGYDPETHQISVRIVNGENCGCNEFNLIDGNTCEESSSSVVQNNLSVTNLVFGLHYDSFEYDTDCAETTQFHPNWTFVTSGIDNEWFTGDTVNLTLNPPFGWECILDNPQEDLCWELVVWQINLSQTASIDDFPTEYWTDTCGTCANQTQRYPDIDLSNNTLVWCPDELPPPPLYPGCTDELAVNFDPNATTDDGSCEYPAIPGCTDPTACNYNQEADENDNTCIYCDTPGGEVHCNAYHNSNYWDFYCNLFDCCAEESIVDIQLDSIWVEYTSCNVYNQPQGACQEGIRYHQVATNIGTDSIYSYQWTWNGPNGWTNTSVEFGVNFPNNPFYAVALPPGQTTNVLNSFNQELVWEEGDELCVTVSVVGDQVDEDLTNNTACVTLPAYPVCIWGCMDPCAENYNEEATCDSENCEYPDPIVDTVYVELPQDTVFIETIDTVFVELPQDTVVIELPPDTITVIEYVQITDTLEIEVIEYIYLTDTIVEVQFIDCNTGLPCEDDPIGSPTDDDCWPWSVYIPNTFTPNNDGWNDVWKIILDLGCWVDVEFRIYNRWGGLVFVGEGDNYDSYPYWDGSMQGGPSYVADGVYVYTFKARRWNSPQVHQKNGHITIFR